MITVVTAVLGPTEPPPPPPFPGPRYVCSTDRDDVPGWEVISGTSGNWSQDPRRCARYVKIRSPLVFSDDVSIWVDASFDWLASPSTLLEHLGDADVAAFAHPDRTRIRDEANEIVRIGLAPAARVAEQISDYRSAGFDTDTEPQTTLTTTGLMVFRPSAKLAKFLDLWRFHVARYTVRDQLAVDFCARESGIRIAHLPGHYRANPFVFYNRERHRRRRRAA